MTDEDRMRIVELRKEGNGYKRIAQLLGISKAYSAKVSEGLEFLKRIKENINYSVNEETERKMLDMLGI